jgi:hypothetical protein
VKKKVFSLKTAAKGAIPPGHASHPSNLEWSTGPRMSASDKVKFNWACEQFFEVRGMRPPWARRELKLKKYER